MSCSELQTLAVELHEVAKDKGFWNGQVDPNFILAKLALVNSEVAEILEAYRKQHGAEAIAVEFADTIIRLLDLWSGMQEEDIIPRGLDITSVIKMKTDVNKDRPERHGNLI